MILVDTGPIVAIASKRDQNHGRCLALLPTLVGPLVTTWACIAESMHLVYRFGGHAAQDEIWGYITDGLLEIHVHDETERLQMRALMRQYHDTPMDLADASLVASAIALNTRRVFTLDSDFYVYRAGGGASFDVLP